MIDQHFVELKKNSNAGMACEPFMSVEEHANKGAQVVGKILDITDDESLKLLIDSIKNESVLRIMSECMNEFGEYYFKMSLSDWNKVVKNYLDR